jgi:hypothetical protein
MIITYDNNAEQLPANPTPQQLTEHFRFPDWILRINQIDYELDHTDDRMIVARFYLPDPPDQWTKRWQGKRADEPMDRKERRLLKLQRVEIPWNTIRDLHVY